MVNELEEKGIKFVQVELNSANTNEPCISYDDILEFHETLDDEDRSRQWQKDLLDLDDLRKEGARFENWFMRICAEFTGADR